MNISQLGKSSRGISYGLFFIVLVSYVAYPALTVKYSVSALPMVILLLLALLWQIFTVFHNKRSPGAWILVVVYSIALVIHFQNGFFPTYPPAEFRKQLATADRVVVTNRYSAFGLTVTGEDASRLATAVASAKQDRLPADAVFDWDLEFYAGTNFLMLIHLQDRAFMLSHTQFSDDTGVLKTFWQKLESERRGHDPG